MHPPVQESMKINFKHSRHYYYYYSSLHYTDSASQLSIWMAVCTFRFHFTFNSKTNKLNSRLFSSTSITNSIFLLLPYWSIRWDRCCFRVDRCIPRYYIICTDEMIKAKKRQQKKANENKRSNVFSQRVVQQMYNTVHVFSVIKFKHFCGSSCIGPGTLIRMACARWICVCVHNSPFCRTLFDRIWKRNDSFTIMCAQAN